MKKIIIIFTFAFSASMSFAQCADDYVGDFGSGKCYDSDTLNGWLTEIKALTPTKIVLIHFWGIPYSMIGRDDTIVADLDCLNDSLNLIPITYTLMGMGAQLSFSGHGRMYQGALIINYHYTNPNGTSDDCWGYYNVTGIQDIKSVINTINVSPNPADKLVRIDTKLDIIEIEIIDLFGQKHVCNLDNDNILDISNLDIGIYFLKVRTVNNELVIKKIIKI